MSVMVTCDQQQPDRQIVKQVVQVLETDGVAVVPTDSVYGLICRASKDNPAHRRIFAIKERNLAQTLPLFLGSEKDLATYGREVPAWAHTLAQVFWPGALTLVVKAAAEWPREYVCQDTQTVAVRVPDSRLIQKLVGEVGPLAQTSANLHGKPSPISAAGLDPAVMQKADIVVDSGVVPLAQASTIVDCTGAKPKVLRQGAIDTAQIDRALM